MVYHPLSDDTAQTPERRREEAETHLAVLNDVVAQMTDTEQTFIGDMQIRDFCSVKQLFWLRDLREKYGV